MKQSNTFKIRFGGAAHDTTSLKHEWGPTAFS